jgi:LPXTG-motif cell wall-anchored protein
MSHSGRRKYGVIVRAGVPALVLALAGVAVTAPAASAVTVDVKYDCATPIGARSAVSPINITASKSGSAYKLVMSFTKGVSSSPAELGKGAVNPSALIVLGGADSGTVKVSGAANAAVIPANTPIKINDLSGTYTPKKSGTVTFTAGVLTIKALGTTTTCTPGNKPGPSLSLDVTAAGGASASSSSTSGGSSSSSSSSTSSGSGSSGNDALPQTGPADNAIALGVFGGTLLLLGTGGVLWLTRRNI